ncbi:MAG TPA: VOC family protein [Chitinophagaceae bacterium]
MKKLFIILFFFILVTLTGFSQSKSDSYRMGEVACVYMTTADLDSSVALYEKLGFQITGSNTFLVSWAQVSDGSLLIMLRKDPKPFIGLTYYSAEIEKTVEQLEKDGIIFTQKPKETDPIKRYYFRSPDGFNIMLASNLGGFKQPAGMTMIDMKPADFSKAEQYPNKQCGVFGEFCHPVADLNASIAFWKKLGFTSKYQEAAPYPHAIISDGLMIIGLHQTNHFDYPAITYFGLDTEKRIQQLKEKGLKNFTEVAGKNNQSLTTWEGQHFFLFSMGM